MNPDRFDRLVQIRRHIHAHPETARKEFGTTAFIAEQLTAAGLAPQIFPGGTGLYCDIGDGRGPLVALRADIDALPVADEKEVPYRSTQPGTCHACGHDVHTTIMLGVALELAQAPEAIEGRARFIFQPAEEAVPSGAHDAIAAGVLKDVAVIYALHCDPAGEVGRVGIRTGPITSSLTAFDIQITQPPAGTAPGAHPADLVMVMAKLITDLPTALQNALPPGAAMVASAVFGTVNSVPGPDGRPERVTSLGTVRSLSREAWAAVPELFERLASAIVSPYGVTFNADFNQVAPAVTNDPDAMRVFDAAVTSALEPGARYETPQSLGGEDFAWYLESVPGGLARLGVRPRGRATAYDLHSGRFDVDEECIAVGVKLMRETLRLALTEYSAR
ncbi:amidohydrolase [Streptomyces sp. SID13666]|uniref:amidohydrolase n=1 Tax=Streptomyces sp. SID13666 TaxID=2706054 RepID=UPI0013C03CD9|nr:amidohydrolase [Streptomyces sp. SID13666]NEA59617.1 amidohydrolase [Streptomyces sp. SID13666]